MSIFTLNRSISQSKVPNSDYIRTENKTDDSVTKPAEPIIPAEPKAK